VAAHHRRDRDAGGAPDRESALRDIVDLTTTTATRGLRAAAALAALVIAIVPAGCVDNGACRSGSTVPSASSKDGVVGCGGPYDQIYQEIYTPGSGTQAGA
jgi:hypothetical protein